MKIEYHKNFVKNFKKRIRPNNSLNKKFQERLVLFISDPTNIVLKNHRLTGTKRDLYAFSVAGDVRVLYEISGQTYRFIDIGSHNQVYK